MAPRDQARKAEPADKAEMSAKLLAWYDRHHRDLPWRTAPSEAAKGRRADPYHVWLSEIMLQQTTVSAVKPYFQAFLAKWPTVDLLAAAAPDDIMKAWAGLGYYSRARNLKKCADHVSEVLGGTFPDTEERLLDLPGVGAYTAAAVAAIAFNRPAAVMDGNVERVMTRLYAIDAPLPGSKPEIRRRVEALVPTDRPGDFAQATMDLGATICTPKRPACIVCPVNDICEALKLGDPERFPRKGEKAEKPVRVGATFVARRADGAVLLRKRPESGLLGGMAEVPTTAWTARMDGETGVDAAPFAATWKLAGRVRHVFTHFELDLTVYHALVEAIAAPPGAWWSQPDALPGEALPTVMKKAIEAAIPGATAKVPAQKAPTLRRRSTR